MASRVSPDERGVAHVTNARWDAVDATARKTSVAGLRTAKSCGPVVQRFFRPVQNGGSAQK